MSKYIDKEVLLEHINRTRPYEGEDGSFERHRRLQWLADIGQVNMCPTVDVEPQLKGEWLKVTVEGWDLKKRPMIRCSHCGWTFSAALNPRNFCPSCGARMRGDED